MSLTAKNIFFCFLLWTAVVMLDVAGNFFEGVFREIEVHWGEVIPFAAAWYIWFFLTFPAVYIASRYPVSVEYPNKIWIHVVTFLILNIIQILLAALVISSLLNWLNDETYRNLLQKTAFSGTFYNLFIYIIIVVLVNSLRYYQQLREEKNKTIELEKQIITSRINFLKQQLQPHFLFNTHHSIITLMKMGEKEKAVEMMEKLSDLMRFALREDTTQEITLEKELSVLKLYLDIQRIRFEDKLQVEFDVPKHLLTCLVPSMILQPVVENSIKYAVEKSSSACTIHIKAEDKGANLILTIKDGVKEPLVTTTINKGIGLSNTEERLERLYSTGQHLKMQQYNENGLTGVQVNIQIPLHYA